MAVNRDKPDRWKADIAQSVDLFNEWFLVFAPKAFRDTRIAKTRAVEAAFSWTENFASITPQLLRDHPDVLQMLRMACCPPIARDRLVGLSRAAKSFVNHIEKKNSVPARMRAVTFEAEANKIIATIQKLIDSDIFVWLGRTEKPQVGEIHRAGTIIADRLCGAIADPIVRNAQEERQLNLIERWLAERGYARVTKGVRFSAMEPGSFGFRMNALLRAGLTTIAPPALTRSRDGAGNSRKLVSALRTPRCHPALPLSG